MRALRALYFIRLQLNGRRSADYGQPAQALGRLTPKCKIALAAACARRSLKSVASAPDYHERIALDPEIRFGKPTVRGTRITVGDVLSYLAGGMSAEEVLANSPQLTLDDVRACLAFAADRERRLAS